MELTLVERPVGRGPAQLVCLQHASCSRSVPITPLSSRCAVHAVTASPRPSSGLTPTTSDASPLPPPFSLLQRELELIAEALRIPGNKSLGPVAKVGTTPAAAAAAGAAKCLSSNSRQDAQKQTAVAAAHGYA
jgi:hypothetical protein